MKWISHFWLWEHCSNIELVFVCDRSLLHTLHFNHSHAFDSHQFTCPLCAFAQANEPQMIVTEEKAAAAATSHTTFEPECAANDGQVNSILVFGNWVFYWVKKWAHNQWIVIQLSVTLMKTHKEVFPILFSINSKYLEYFINAFGNLDTLIPKQYSIDENIVYKRIHSCISTNYPHYFVSIKFGETPVSKISDTICLLKFVSFHIRYTQKPIIVLHCWNTIVLTVDRDKSILVFCSKCSFRCFLLLNGIKWYKLSLSSPPNKWNGNETNIRNTIREPNIVCIHAPLCCWLHTPKLFVVVFVLKSEKSHVLCWWRQHFIFTYICVINMSIAWNMPKMQ